LGKQNEALLLKAIRNDIESKKDKTDGYEKWVELAELFERQNKLDFAYLCYVRALRKKKDNKELHRARALCCRKLGKNYMYLNIMSKKVLTSPLTPDFLQDILQTAELYFGSSNSEAAIGLLKRGFEDLGDAKIALQLLLMLVELKEYAQILEFCTSKREKLRTTHLAPDFNILSTIALLNTSTASEKQIEGPVLDTIRSLRSASPKLAAQLAAQLETHELYKAAEQLYLSLADIPEAPIYPQAVLMLNKVSSEFYFRVAGGV
jgi:hypothetical protein